MNRIAFSLASTMLAYHISLPVQSKELVDIQALPTWFQNAYKRTIDIKKHTQIKINAHNFDAQIIGDVSLVSSENGVWYYLVDIGTASPIECYVFNDFDGTANSLSNVIDASLEGVTELNKKPLVSRFNMSIDVGVIHDVPFISLDTMYNLGEGKQTVSGVLKGLSAQTQNSLQICVHNETGYQDAFFSVFESLINGFVETDTDKPFFEPVFKLSLNDVPVGYGLEKHSIDADGDIFTYTETAMIVPVDASNVSVSDSVQTEWSRTNGSVINTDSYTIENGQYSAQLALKPEEGKWEVTGSVQGKAIELTLAHEDWLLSGFGAYLASAQLLASQDSSASYKAWINEADPSTALPFTINKIKDDSDFNLAFQMGPIDLKYLANENGAFEKGKMNQGPIEVIIDKLYQHGQPVLP